MELAVPSFFFVPVAVITRLKDLFGLRDWSVVFFCKNFLEDFLVFFRVISCVGLAESGLRW